MFFSGFSLKGGDEYSLLFVGLNKKVNKPVAQVAVAIKEDNWFCRRSATHSTIIASKRGRRTFLTALR